MRVETVGPFWQPKYFDNIMRRVRDFWAKLEYIHNNPVAAGLVANAGDWRWSSYTALIKPHRIPNFSRPTRSSGRPRRAAVVIVNLNL